MWDAVREYFVVKTIENVLTNFGTYEGFQFVFISIRAELFDLLQCHICFVFINLAQCKTDVDQNPFTDTQALFDQQIGGNDTLDATDADGCASRFRNFYNLSGYSKTHGFKTLSFVYYRQM
ncbi:Uncharacterised protein [Corynebacterium renale]|nr:Uncharacterised protein [Corynebacterium renale]STC96934.1 Uncharacterised protein [Corynebacterium renale]